MPPDRGAGPDAGQLLQWRWLVVRDRSVNERLGAIFRAHGAAYPGAMRERLGDAPPAPALARNLASGKT